MYAETPGCMYADFACMYAETVVCKVCGLWVHLYGNFWAQSMRLLGASIWKLLGASMRLLDASLTAAVSLPDSR